MIRLHSLSRSFALAAVILAALVPLVPLAGCGGSPSGPDGQGVIVRGTVAASTFAAASTGETSAVITVTVAENTAITATASADGTFTLRGLPEGAFTLIFYRDGLEVGRLTFDAVAPNQEIILTVAVTSAGVTLLEEQRNGIGHGDIETEGLVQTVITLNAAGDSRFLIAGRTVIARPGVTAIREGNSARTVNDVTVGRRVHVKGVWLALEGTVQPVLAHEIKLQGDETADPPSGSTCMINGGRVGSGIELEGRVASGGAAGFMLNVNGNRASGPVQVNTSGATFQCHPANGPNAPTPAQCQASVTSNARVHVRGTLQSCDTANALVAASHITVQ